MYSGYVTGVWFVPQALRCTALHYSSSDKQSVKYSHPTNRVDHLPSTSIQCDHTHTTLYTRDQARTHPTPRTFYNLTKSKPFCILLFSQNKNNQNYVNLDTEVNLKQNDGFCIEYMATVTKESVEIKFVIRKFSLVAMVSVISLLGYACTAAVAVNSGR